MLAGIDVGTTGCKCSVYSREGILKREAYEEYPAGQEKNSGRELDPASVWSCVKKVMKETAQKGESWEAVRRHFFRRSRGTSGFSRSAGDEHTSVYR